MLQELKRSAAISRPTLTAHKSLPRLIGYKDLRATENLLCAIHSACIDGCPDGRPRLGDGKTMLIRSAHGHGTGPGAGRVLSPVPQISPPGVPQRFCVCAVPRKKSPSSRNSQSSKSDKRHVTRQDNTKGVKCGSNTPSMNLLVPRLSLLHVGPHLTAQSRHLYQYVTKPVRGVCLGGRGTGEEVAEGRTVILGGNQLTTLHSSFQ